MITVSDGTDGESRETSLLNHGGCEDHLIWRKPMLVQTISTSPLIKRYTLQEFWELPHPPGGGHYELIGGVLYMVAPPLS